MAKKPTIQIGPRDEALLETIDYHPFTTSQLVCLSKTFNQSFPDEHTLRRRLRRLAQAGLVKAYPYAVASLGRSPSYWKLTRAGYRQVHGSDALLPQRRHFQPVSGGHHAHTHALARLLASLLLAVESSDFTMTGFMRENSHTIETSAGSLRPDCRFTLIGPDHTALNFVVELDNGTERIESKQDIESIQRKICSYDADQQNLSAFDARRYVVLLVTTRTDIRLQNMLATARRLVSNPQRRLFLGTTLSQLESSTNPLSSKCFLDTTGKKVAMLPQSIKRQSTDHQERTRFNSSSVAFC